MRAEAGAEAEAHSHEAVGSRAPFPTVRVDFDAGFIVA